jgi:hypothetical protein
MIRDLSILQVNFSSIGSAIRYSGRSDSTSRRPRPPTPQRPWGTCRASRARLTSRQATTAYTLAWADMARLSIPTTSSTAEYATFSARSDFQKLFVLKYNYTVLWCNAKGKPTRASCSSSWNVKDLETHHLRIFFIIQKHSIQFDKLLCNIFY